MFVSILLSCSGWCSCVLGPLWSPISWPPCSDCAPPSSPSQTPADDSNQQTHTHTRQAWVNTTGQPASNTHQHDSMCGRQKLLMKLKKVWQKDCFLLTPLIQCVMQRSTVNLWEQIPAIKTTNKWKSIRVSEWLLESEFSLRRAGGAFVPARHFKKYMCIYLMIFARL